MSRNLKAVPAPRRGAPEPAAATVQPTRHVDALRPHPDNPREEISQEDPRIVEMAGSIEKYGVIEPLVITPGDIVLAGHRRRIASRLAAERFNRPDLMYVPVVVRDIDEAAALDLMLQENMQRASLNPLEEARAMQAIKERRNFRSNSDLARHLKLPSTDISHRLSILRLAPEIQSLYRENEMPLGAAPLLSRVANRDKQISYAGLLARRQITVAVFKKKVEKDLAALPPSVPTLGEPAFVDDRSRHAAVPAGARGRKGKRAKGGPSVGQQQQQQLAPTRAEASASLSKVLGRRVSMISVRSVLEATCCSCGMSGQEDVCRSCPLPRLVMGLVGRSE